MARIRDIAKGKEVDPAPITQPPIVYNIASDDEDEVLGDKEHEITDSSCLPPHDLTSSDMVDRLREVESSVEKCVNRMERLGLTICDCPIFELGKTMEVQGNFYKAPNRRRGGEFGIAEAGDSGIVPDLALRSGLPGL